MAELAAHHIASQHGDQADVGSRRTADVGLQCRGLAGIELVGHDWPAA